MSITFKLLLQKKAQQGGRGVFEGLGGWDVGLAPQSELFKCCVVTLSRADRQEGATARI